MSKPFITEEFFLEGDEARQLYHEYAAGEPILDYHSHLPAREIAEDRSFETILDAWLAHDHYKWRAMRANGVKEDLITGEASAKAKFRAWADTVPHLLGNPLYHWTHLELKRYFDIDLLLNADNADAVWDECNKRLESLTCRRMLEQMNVRVVCTTDDPADSLEYHEAIASDKAFNVRVLPTWRPDRALSVEHPPAFNAWVDRLSDASQTPIQDFEGFWQALQRRHADFHTSGCRLSDHGLETMYAEAAGFDDAAPLFNRLRQGDPLSSEEQVVYKSAMLYELAKLDAEKGWAQQFHVGVLRNNSTRLYNLMGPDAGADSMADRPYAQPMNRFFDRLDAEGRLAKTIVYNLNPSYNAVVATALGNFQGDDVPGKMQFGAAWWFLDQKDGIEAQIQCLAQLGILSRFVGMVTDSRSFMSFPRHEYFRRVLSNILGHEMRVGLLPKDFRLVGGMLRNICYANAERYFGFPDV